MTDGDSFGYQLAFEEGLNLIRADNNMGKTTLLTSILYSLGWEGMLGPTRTPPFKPSATEEIEGAKGSRHRVLGSSASAELEGDLGAVITVERAIKSDSERSELVKTWRGRGLTDQGDVTKQGDYYAREPGAASRAAGYQSFLDSFIGWTMPLVSRFEGDPVPLYAEVVAPFLFVEQTRGWSRIAATVPRYLGIRDPDRRAVEFLLSMDSLTRSRERGDLIAQREEARAGWKAVVQGFSTRAEERGARISSLPENATASCLRTYPCRSNYWTGTSGEVSKPSSAAFGKKPPQRRTRCPAFPRSSRRSEPNSPRQKRKYLRCPGSWRRLPGTSASSPAKWRS